MVLSARGLRRDFGGFTAVKNVDLDVHDASVHALIGPNGAGKTTVFNLLTKFLQPTAGTITLHGHGHHAIRRRIRWRAWGWSAPSRFPRSFRT